MKNIFYFTLKVIFIFKILKYHVEKLLDEKAKINFKIYDVMNWETNNYNKNIALYLKK